MIDNLTDKTNKKMTDAINSLKREFDTISTGRATPALLDAVRADIYGSMMPLNQLATISVLDASTLSIQVWDRSSVKNVEKAILNSNLGFNPLVDGTLIRINIPKLSEERRKELVKLAKKYSEDKKIVVRNIRRDIMEDIKKMEKDNLISKDQNHSFTAAIQKITDEFVNEIDKLLSTKEKEILKI